MTLWGDSTIKNILALAHLKNKFLFEINPSLFPGGELSAVEIVLWENYYQELENGRHK